MRKLLMHIVLCFCLYASAHGQTNLVPNGSFEEYNNCPVSNSAIEESETTFKYVKDWMRPSGGTPEYFNACNTRTNSVGTPFNEGGYQVPKSGNAYTGIFVYYFKSGDDNFREYLQVKLKQTLIAGQKYIIKFYVSAAQRFSVPNISAFVSDTRYTNFSTKTQLDLKAQVNNTTPIKDSANWYEVSGIFTAAGNEEWLIIGNFLSDNNSGPVYDIYLQQEVSGTFCHSYVYIDDVSLTIWSEAKTNYLCNKQDSVKISIENKYPSFKWFDNDIVNRERYFKAPIDGVIEKTLSSGGTVKDSFYIKEIPYIFDAIIGDTSICVGQSLKLRKTIPFIDLVWSTGDIGSETTINAPNKYWLKSSYLGCTRIDTFTVNKITPPILPPIRDTFFCKNTPLTISISNPNNYNIKWNTGETANEIQIKNEGTYSINYSDNVCANTNTFKVNDKSVTPFRIDGKSFICMDKQEKTILKAPKYAQNIWYPLNIDSNLLLISVADRYWHTATNEFGCSYTDTLFVKDACEPLLFMPNAFTPNGDGLNDYLNFAGKYIDSFHLTIYNRWGDLVFETFDFNSKWDGTFQNKPLPSDVYFYTLNYASIADLGQKEIKGNITIIH